MKKIFLLFALLLVIANGFSQSKKNDLRFTLSALPLIGSSGGFESGMNGIVIKPSVGYNISERTSIDLNFAYTSLNDLKVGNINSNYNSFAIVPTMRNNFINKEKFRVFAEFGFGLGTIKYNADDSHLRTFKHEELSGGISILNIGVGANYFFNDKFGLEIIIPYINTTNITSNNSINLYSGIGPTIGFTYKFN